MNRQKGKNMEAQHKLIVGGTGYGKSMISVWMDQQRYEEFQRFCEQNDLEYHLLSHKGQERCLVACETSVMNQFRFGSFMDTMGGPKSE